MTEITPSEPPKKLPLIVDTRGTQKFVGVIKVGVSDMRKKDKKGSDPFGKKTDNLCLQLDTLSSFYGGEDDDPETGIRYLTYTKKNIFELIVPSTRINLK